MNDFHSSVQKIIRETRNLSLPHFGNVPYEEKDNSGGNFITEIDVAVENSLKEKLHALDPTIGFVGEETGGDATQERFWLCDPIDGTDAFIRGIPFSTTMLALIENGIVIKSYIYHFVSDTMYHAERGNGAYCEGERIHVSQRPVRTSMMCIHSRDKTIVHHFINRHMFIHTATSGYKFSLIAHGKIEGVATINGYGKMHDHAPGSLLAEEAGATITNLDKDNYDITNLDYICATPALHSALVETYNLYNEDK